MHGQITASPSTWLTSCLPDEPAETAGHEGESTRTEGVRRRERRPTGVTERLDTQQIIWREDAAAAARL